MGIRNHIFTLVLYHSANTGFIAPLHPSWHEPSNTGHQAIVNGRNETVVREETQRHREEGPRLEAHIVHEDGETSSTVESNQRLHVCGHECLL